MGFSLSVFGPRGMIMASNLPERTSSCEVSGKGWAHRSDLARHFAVHVTQLE
jgi:hypothetical protein